MMNNAIREIEQNAIYNINVWNRICNMIDIVLPDLLSVEPKYNNAGLYFKRNNNDE